MITLAKYHTCNHCVVGEKTFKNILIGPGKLPGLSRNGTRVLKWVWKVACFGSGLGKPGGTPLPRIPRSIPRVREMSTRSPLN